MHRLLPLVLGALIAAFLLPAAVAAQPPSAGSVTRPITGTIDGGGTFVGTLEITRFANRTGDIVALGQVTGTATTTSGSQAVSQAVTLPVDITQATCDILHLELGPLDLNVLGLVIHLDQVVLDITAEQGPGNLLGNLLCAIDGLLDPGPSPINAIVALLNQILAILRGL
jgi:ABC-type amino acid transport substrate-binding protein